MSKNNINCPSCGTDIDISNALKVELEQEYSKRLQQEKQKIVEDHMRKESALQEQMRAFEEKKKNENELFQERLKKERKVLEGELKKKVEGDYELKLNAQKEEIEAYQLKARALQEKEIENEKLKRNMADMGSKMELQLQKQLNEERLKIKEAAEKQASEKMEMERRALKKQLEDQKRLTEEMQRKQEQGSMQLQGEVQELAIEEWLDSNFPYDTIDEIKKGARGGDCIQIVRDSLGHECGTIYYESKRTKAFQPAWIEKFKQDIRARGADIGVIVTESMPKQMERLGEMKGIWICSFEEFKSLCFVLRATVLQIHQVSEQQKGKGDKMSMLYGYLTSNEFKMQMEAIVEGFTQMNENLAKEKRSTMTMWKRREKEIAKVTQNTIDMYGSIKGIAGKAIPTVEQLELQEGVESEEGEFESEEEFKESLF